MIMKGFAVPILCLFLAAAADAQGLGIIECGDDTSVTAWEKPGSLFVARQISCGETVLVLGHDSGYVKIQFGNRIGYVASMHVRQTEAELQQAEPEEPGVKLRPLAPGEQKELPRPSHTAAAERDSRSIAGDAWQRRRNASLSFEMSRIEYKEPQSVLPWDHTALFMKEDGIMFGVSGDYAFFPKRFMLKLDGRFSVGQVDYFSPASGSFPDLRDYHLETRFSFGYVYRASESARLIPFAGIGYRYLVNKLGEAEPGGYDRRTKYLYSPVGVEGTVILGNGWSIAATAEYDLFWRGWQYSEMGDYDAALDTVVNTQEAGWGARVSATFIRNLGPVDFTFGPYIRYWDVDNSVINYYPDGTYVLEPFNKSKEWGGKVGIRF
jgi:hypothetical protein